MTSEERIAEKRQKIKNLNEDNGKEQARINKLNRDIKELEKVEIIKDLIKSISKRFPLKASSLESSLKDDLIKTHRPTPQDIVAVTETERAIARAQGLDEHGSVAGLNRSATSEPASATGFYADQKLKCDNKLGWNGRYASMI